ncbi:MAG: DUF4388 domain-containing protein [Blastocatellia bacterium]
METQSNSEPEICGALEDVSLPDVMRQIYTGRRTGELVVMKDRVRRRVFFEMGRAIFATSNRRGDRLGAFLVRRGDITPAVFEMVDGMVPRGQRFGQLLVEMGLITEDQLASAVREQILAIIYSLFECTRGTFEFAECVTASVPDDLKLELSMADIILEGVGRIRDLAVVRRGMGDLNRLIAPNAEPLLRLQQATLRPPEQDLLSQITETTDLLGILVFSQHPAADTIRALYGLISAGFLTWASAPSAKAIPTVMVLADYAESLEPAEDNLPSEPAEAASSLAADNILEIAAPVWQAADAEQGLVIELTPGLPTAEKFAPEALAVTAPETETQSLPADVSDSGDSELMPENVRQAVSLSLTGEGASEENNDKLAACPAAVPNQQLSEFSPGADEPSGRVMNGHQSQPEPQSSEDELRRAVAQIRVRVMSGDPYAVFGLSAGAGREQLRAAYHELLRRYHPDKFRQASQALRVEVEEVFKGINIAWNRVQAEARRIVETATAEVPQVPRRAPRTIEMPFAPVTTQVPTVSSSVIREEAGVPEKLSDQELLHIADSSCRSAVSLLMAKQYAEAAELLRKAVNISPTNAKYRSLLALALASNSQRSNPKVAREAEQHYLEAIRLDPQDPYHHALLGMLYSKLGMARRAESVYRQALRLDPRNEIALKGLAAKPMGVELLLHLMARV